MPKKLRANDIGIKADVFIFESPIMARPASSGKGDAMIKAPINGISHLKSFGLNIETSLSCLVFRISQ